jgi:hypothetical protein
MKEYHLEPGENVILISGSKTSGGFGISKKSLLEQSKISDILSQNPELANFELEKGKAIKFKGRLYCWVSIENDGVIILPQYTQKAYNIKPGDYLLSIRGSDIALGFAVKGIIIEEAKKHPEIDVFK